jgi:hypothetical protein
MTVGFMILLVFSVSSVENQIKSQMTQSKTKRVGRKEYDWPVDSEKPARHKTLGPKVVSNVDERRKSTDFSRAFAEKGKNPTKVGTLTP